MTKSRAKGQKPRGKTRARILLAVIATMATVRAATLHGVVLDAETREPVPYADVRAPNLNLNATADSLGRFALDLPAGLKRVTIGAGRIGYDDARWEEVRVAEAATFFLQPSSLVLKGVTVSAFRSPVPQAKSGPVWVLDNQMLRPMGRLSVADALDATPSLFTKDYGNMSTISLRGANTEQTMVLLDGIRLNTAQDNLADLSTLPLAAADRIEIVRGNNSALYGANTVGGLVNVMTADPERLGAVVTAGLGSFGKRYLQFQHTNWLQPLGYLVAVNLSRTDRTFSYRDSADSVRTRLNSDIANSEIMFKGKYEQGRHLVTLLGEYDRTDRGVPGPTYWPSDSARTVDFRGIAHLDYEFRETDNSRLEATLYDHEFWRHYWDPDTTAPANDTHATAVRGVMLKQAVHVARWATGLAGVEADREQFRSTAIGTPQRTTGSGWLEARLGWLGFDVTPAARFDWLYQSRPMPDSTLFFSNTRVISPKISVTWSGLNWLSLYASGGRSFRAPTFNELYWPKDQWTSGNPHLKPEHATSADLAATLRYSHWVSARVGGFYSRLTDLIQWTPDSNYVFTPVNVDTATITGGELELAAGYRHAGVVGNATYMVARSHGKDLIYRPRLSLALSPWLAWQRFGLNCDVRYTGARYTQTDDSDSLPGYVLLDVGASYDPHLGRLSATLRAGVRNLFDRQYEVMQGYPVPGRNWYAELELKL